MHPSRTDLYRPSQKYDDNTPTSLPQLVQFLFLSPSDLPSTYFPVRGLASFLGKDPMTSSSSTLTHSRPWTRLLVPVQICRSQCLVFGGRRSRPSHRTSPRSLSYPSWPHVHSLHMCSPTGDENRESDERRGDLTGGLADTSVVVGRPDLSSMEGSTVTLSTGTWDLPVWLGVSPPGPGRGRGRGRGFPFFRWVFLSPIIEHSILFHVCLYKPTFVNKIKYNYFPLRDEFVIK